MTVFEAYNDCKKRLQLAGVTDYGYEARVILRKATGYNNTQILSKYNQILTPLQESQLTALIHQRETRYPLQYMFGEWEFYGLPFRVGPGVLIPRADTEIAVDVALKLLEKAEKPQVLDLCAGSGCIGIAIAKKRDDAAVTLLEKYPQAFRFAEQNVQLNDTKNVTVTAGDIFESALAENQYDLIISNPPYVEADEMETLQPELAYEPDTALYGGEDGLMFYRAITMNYRNALKPGGKLVYEVGEKQAESVSGILLENGFSDIGTEKDYNGVVRVVFGTVKAIE